MNKFKTTIRWTLVMLFVFTINLIPNTSYAGVFSVINSISTIFGVNFPYAEINSVDEGGVNSQNIQILQAATNINPSIGGGDITIIDEMALMSESGVSGTTLDIEKAENAGKISSYTVREGDTLSQIADMFGVSANTIRWANDLSGSIQPGDTLVILPVSGITHVVKHGGDIKDIADIYHADVREIALFNGVDKNTYLEPGTEIIVPHVDSHDSGRGVIKKTGETTAVASSYFINPVPGGIITQGVHGYNGIDVGALYGTPIYAAASGKVITSKQGGWNGGYGNYIVLSHDNGTQTLYSHNSSNSVYVGQFVTKGEVIGYIGSTGRSTGNHLHFEVRGGTNPLSECSVGSVCR